MTFPSEELEPILYDKESILLKCHGAGQTGSDIVEELLFFFFIGAYETAVQFTVVSH